MQQLIAALTSNPHYLKACILYEVLQRKPVFDSYRSFCETIGDGVMDYVDFEYWFYRFYNGNCDFDHDRSQDPKQKVLVELPVEVLSKIAKEVDPMERALFSTMSKAIKRICEIHRPQYEEVEVSVSSNHYHLVLDQKTLQYSNGNFRTDGDVDDILYKGLAVSKQAFHIPKLEIEHLSLYWQAYGYNIANIIPHGLHVKSIEIKTQQPNAIVKVLERFQPGTLEKIVLDSQGGPVYLPSILGLQQFKEAKEVDFKDCGTVFTKADLRRFSHLEKFEVNFDGIRPEVVFEIRDMLSNSETFRSCYIASSRILDVDEICEALGENVQEEDIATYRYRIEESNAFLEFEIEWHGIQVEKVFADQFFL